MKKIRVLTLEINNEKNLLEKKLRWIDPDIILESMQKIRFNHFSCGMNDA